MVRALRITYVGELGFELHIPKAYAGDIYDALMKAGESHGIVNAGYRAIESLRLEKGYRAFAVDITPNDTPFEAGLGWAVKLDSGVDFLGRQALVEQKRKGLTRRLVGFSVDDSDIVLLGRETIFRDGERVGWLTSGGWGYTVGKCIGYGYVKDAFQNANGVDTTALRSSTYELEVATKRVSAELHLRPLYDPGMKRVRS